MSSVAKRPDGRWRARYRDDAGKEHARHFVRKTDAQRWLDETTTALVSGQYVDPSAGRVTFRVWWTEWSGRQVWAQGTREAAEQAAASVTFADVQLRALRPSHVETWVRAMTQPGRRRAGALAASTVRTRFTYVQSALRAAVRDRLIPSDPSEGVALPRVRRAGAAMTIPSPERVRAALDAAPDRFRAFVALCAFAGLRLGEAAGVQVGDVDFLRRALNVRRQVQGATRVTTRVTSPKYGSERTVAVPDALAQLVAAHVGRFGAGGEGYLFGSGPDLLNRNSAGHLWRETRDRAGLGEFTLHDLRHFYASGLIAAGCDVVTVQRALGHSSASVTLNTYAHLWPSAEDRTRAAAGDLMSEVLGAAADPVRTAGH